RSGLRGRPMPHPIAQRQGNCRIDMSIAFAPEANLSIASDLAAEADFDADVEFASNLVVAPEPQQVPPAPFGWYPDPAGSPLLRWWNGTAWTNRLEVARPELQVAAGYSTHNLLNR
ncbi:MAG: DUF2510 domain-containing protein, partial [Lacisediminihabitans sp.]